LHASNCTAFKKAIYELSKVKPQFYIAIKNKINQYKKKIELANNPPAYARVNISF
jgi:hypothetical protein